MKGNGIRRFCSTPPVHNAPWLMIPLNTRPTEPTDTTKYFWRNFTKISKLLIYRVLRQCDMIGIQLITICSFYVLQFFSEYPAMGGHPLLLEWHGSAMISRIVWEFVKGFLERISRLLDSGGRRKSVPICHCPWEKREFIGIDARWHNSKCIPICPPAFVFVSVFVG